MAKETFGEGLTNFLHAAKKTATESIETVVDKVSDVDLSDVKEKFDSLTETAKETGAPVLTSVQEKTKEVGNRFSRAFKAFTNNEKE